MHYLILGYDDEGEEGRGRRLAVRQAHLDLGHKMAEAKQMLFGAALLDDADNMVGSVILCDFASRQELDVWLSQEPYVTGKVWRTTEVYPCRVGPIFEHLFK